MSGRSDYAASCRKLHDLGWREFDPPPPLPARMPAYDDPEPLGVQFFRELVDADLSSLTLPRTFIGRCDVRAVSFRNTDLQESCLCWNDFVDVDFAAANLRLADLRASSFVRVMFTGADLRDADLRRSDFIDCRFDGALVDGMKLARCKGQGVLLSEMQRTRVAWQDDEGEEPDGG